MKRTYLVAAGAFALLAAYFVIDHFVWITDDRSHPDGVLLSEEFAAARAANRSQINLIALNGGNWLAVCLTGPGTDPQDILRQYGRKHRVRTRTIQRVRSWFHVGHVPKGELAVVLVSERLSIRSRRVPNWTGDANFKSACALRNEPGLSWR